MRSPALQLYTLTTDIILNSLEQNKNYKMIQKRHPKKIYLKSHVAELTIPICKHGGN